MEVDGYEAVQLAFGAKKEKNTTAAEKGHFAKAGVPNLRIVKEFRNSSISAGIGSIVSADIFEIGEKVNVTGTSKGKGFQGVVKRHNFSGVGMASHGQHNRLRAPGSVGQCSTPSKIFKGVRMGGRMGADTVTVKGLKVLKIFTEHNLILVNGCVPGIKGGHVIIKK
jgi:large subunit ribosomal protein L3